MSSFLFPKEQRQWIEERLRLAICGRRPLCDVYSPLMMDKFITTSKVGGKIIIRGIIGDGFWMTNMGKENFDILVNAMCNHIDKLIKDTTKTEQELKILRVKCKDAKISTEYTMERYRISVIVSIETQQ